MYSRPHVFGFRNRRAFTLIELLTVIAIIGILAAIIVPTVGKARNVAKKAQCVARIRQWGTAVNLCANDYKQNIPLFFRQDPFTYAPYMSSGKNMTVEAETGATSNRTVIDAMSICPTGINGGNSLNSVKQYAFVVPIGVSLRPGGVFGVGDCYFYRAADAAAPAKLLLMVEVSNQVTVNPGSLGGIKTAIEANNSIRQMQTKDTYIRHGGISHGLFLDGHVGSLTTTDTDYTLSKETLDRYFSLK
jgi:prepilin-type N-terminal cleavage/methylation domain-containing protein/prepilin-type processing-associated H-X9-DG protein